MVGAKYLYLFTLLVLLAPVVADVPVGSVPETVTCTIVNETGFINNWGFPSSIGGTFSQILNDGVSNVSLNYATIRAQIRQSQPGWFQYIDRAGITIDTSGLSTANTTPGYTLVIDSANLSIIATANVTSLGPGNYSFTEYHPLNYYVPRAIDYTNCTTNLLTDERAINQTYTTGRRISLLWNTSRFDYLNITGTTSIMLRQMWDIRGDYAGTTATNTVNNIALPTNATATKPILYIDYHMEKILPVDATFTYNQTQQITPFTVLFNSTSAISPSTYNWTFGDGGTSTVGPTVTHTYYGNSTTYSVKLNVTKSGTSVAESTISNLIVALPKIATWTQTPEGNSALYSTPPTFTSTSNFTAQAASNNTWGFQNATYAIYNTYYGDSVIPVFPYNPTPIIYDVSLNTTNAYGSNTTSYSMYFTATTSPPFVENEEWNPDFDIGKDVDNNDLVHYNASFIKNTHGSTPLTIWVYITIVGIIFIVLSMYYSTMRRGTEIASVHATLAAAASFISALASSAIDIITSSGVTSLVENVNTITNKTTTAAQSVQYDVSNNTQEFVSMTQHTIYNFNLVGLFMWLVFVISIINIIRIHLLRANEFDSGGDKQR